jgi:hypothetical protein
VLRFHCVSDIHINTFKYVNNKQNVFLKQFFFFCFFEKIIIIMILLFVGLEVSLCCCS